MRTKSLPFQLEQTTRGAFLLQGLAGGMLMGFIFTVVLIFVKPNPYNFLFIFYTPLIMAAGGVLGIVKAVPLWAMYRLTGIRMRLPLRVAVSTLGATLVVLLVYYLLDATHPWLLMPTFLWSLLVSLPIALLVGSRVRPWEILTYWRVTFRKHGIKERLSSSGILAMGGVLPLRLLSISSLGYWVLGSAISWSYDPLDTKHTILFIFVPIAYLAVSAYLTFSSPGKFVLLAIGIVLNVPISYMSYFGYRVLPEVHWNDETSTILTIANTILLSAWAAFVATRFIVNTRDFLPPAQATSILTTGIKPDHHCLGSRFLEWREHAA